MKKILLSFLLLLSSLTAFAQTECVKYLDTLCPPSPKTKITSCEKELIKNYTRALYHPLNEHLRKIYIDKSCVPLVDNLLTALNKITPTGPRTLYRGVKMLDKIDALKVGDCFTDLAFVSTSAVEAAVHDFIRYEPKAALFQINSLSGRSISKFSDHSYEKEILLLPNTLLKLEKRADDSPTIERFHFKEVKKSECSVVKK